MPRIGKSDISVWRIFVVAGAGLLFVGGCWTWKPEYMGALGDNEAAFRLLDKAYSWNLMGIGLLALQFARKRQTDPETLAILGLVPIAPLSWAVVRGPYFPVLWLPAAGGALIVVAAALFVRERKAGASSV
jgi:hypothetical protein